MKESEAEDLCIGLNNIGISFLEEEGCKEATKKNEEDFQKNNSKEKTHFNEGILKLQYNKAIEYYEKEISINPQDDNNLKQLALLYKKVGKFNKSEEAIDKLLVLEPDNEDYKKMKILIQQLQNEKKDLQTKIKDKNYSETKILCKKLLEEAPEAYDIQKEYILLLINNDKYHELLLFLLNDVSEENKYIYKDLNFYLALSSYYVCKYEEAKELIKQLKKEEIKDDLKKQCDDILKKIESNEFVINEGEKLMKKKEFDKAIILYNSELEKKENTKDFNSLILSKKAFCHYLKGEYDKALEDSNKSININAKSSYNYVIRGMIKTQMKSEDAKQDFEKAKEIDPSFSNLTKEIKKEEKEDIDSDIDTSSEITAKGNKKKKLERFIKVIPFILKTSDNNIDRYNNCLNSIPKNKLTINKENKTSIEEVKNKGNKAIINNDEISLGLSVFKQGGNINFVKNEEEIYKHEKSEIVAKKILYTISIKEEEDITFKQSFIEKLEKIVNLEYTDEQKAEELEKILQKTGIYIPLKMYIGGLYTFNSEKMSEEQKKEFRNEIGAKINLEEFEMEMKSSYKNKKDEQSNFDLITRERSCIGGKMSKEYDEWIKTVKLKNSDFIQYSEFREIFDFFDENLKNKLRNPINIIKKKYKRKINYMKIIENLKKNKGEPIYLKKNEDLPEIHYDKIEFKKEYKMFQKNEEEIEKYYGDDVVVGMNIISRKTKNGTYNYLNPLLKNKINIKFEPFIFCDMDYLIIVCLMKYPK